MSFGHIKDQKYGNLSAHDRVYNGTFYQKQTCPARPRAQTVYNVTFTNVPTGYYIVRVAAWGDGTDPAMHGDYNYSAFNNQNTGSGFRAIGWSGQTWMNMPLTVTEAGNIPATFKFGGNLAGASMEILKIGDL